MFERFKRYFHYFNPRSPRGLRLHHFFAVTATFLFQSTQPKRAATVLNLTLEHPIPFQSTQPKRAATSCRSACLCLNDISIHAAQEGCDEIAPCLAPLILISIHAAQEGCDNGKRLLECLQYISIHAAQQGGGRSVLLFASRPLSYFNPRSPRGLRRCAGHSVSVAFVVFQSTQPKRAATYEAPLLDDKLERDFNPRSPRGLRLHFSLSPFCPPKISIHAAQEGCDGVARFSSASPTSTFQSTQPKRAATLSLHYPSLYLVYFNPRSPRGLRPGVIPHILAASDFNPRSPRGLRLRAQ